jgi:hypothetical protein
MNVSDRFAHGGLQQFFFIETPSIGLRSLQITSCRWICDSRLADTLAGYPAAPGRPDAHRRHPHADTTPIELMIDTGHPGARIERDLFGQFARRNTCGEPKAKVGGHHFCHLSSLAPSPTTMRFRIASSQSAPIFAAYHSRIKSNPQSGRALKKSAAKRPSIGGECLSAWRR